MSVYDDGRAQARPGDLVGPDPGPRHLLRRAAHGPRARWRRAPDGDSANTGRPTSTITADDGLFAGIDREQPVWMSHGDSITRLPEGFHATAQTDSTPFAGLADAGPQPVRHPVPPRGRPHAARPGRPAQLRRRASPASRRPGRRRTSSRRRSPGSANGSTRHARETGSDGKVICALSGGVDSAVAAALVHRAVGDRLTCIYVDHGLMRKKESELLRATFEQQPRDEPGDGRCARAVPRPPGRRRGPRAEAPDHRRRVHPRLRGGGGASSGRIDFLTQGTLYPDVIEIDDRRDEGRPEDQDPPQRRRPAGRPALPAHRAAALPVQGRGPQGRAGARPARGDGPAPAVPGPGPRHPDHRRGHRRAARHAARGGLDRHRRDQGAPGCIAACGSRSRS